jgi:class 3 adenylate cyclase
MVCASCGAENREGAHGGTVEKFIGDARLAGRPVEQRESMTYALAMAETKVHAVAAQRARDQLAALDGEGAA